MLSKENMQVYNLSLPAWPSEGKTGVEKVLNTL